MYIGLIMDDPNNQGEGVRFQHRLPLLTTPSTGSFPIKERVGSHIVVD
jgi:hypothetical protein